MSVIEDYIELASFISEIPIPEDDSIKYCHVCGNEYPNDDEIECCSNCGALEFGNMPKALVEVTLQLMPDWVRQLWAGEILYASPS